jgi:hypothetical protein
MFRLLRGRREQELAALGEFRSRRKVVAEDVTVVGEQLTELHFDTLATELDAPLRIDYQSALDAYETAKERLGTTASTEDLAPVRAALTDGRYFLACVLARQGVTPAGWQPNWINQDWGGYQGGG